MAFAVTYYHPFLLAFVPPPSGTKVTFDSFDYCVSFEFMQ